MPTRVSEAVWKGGLRDGKGRMRTRTGTCEGPYSYVSRFEDAFGTNPEELLGAAHAGCFSMAFAAELEKAGFTPNEIKTQASVTIEKGTIVSVDLETEGSTSDISENQFLSIAEKAKKECPVSKALAGVEIRLKAKLVKHAEQVS